MSGRDESGGTKFNDDDWFSGTAPSSVDESGQPTRAHPAAGDEPSWLEDPAEPEQQQQPTTAGPFARRRLIALAVAALVVIAVIVVALIAFSGGNSSTATEQTTTTVPTTTTPASTVPANPPPPTPPPTPALVLPAGILRPGATGPEVKTVQRALAQAGHSPGPIDGIYGPKTEQAVADFQRSAGIPADGHYGPQTKQALEQKIASG